MYRAKPIWKIMPALAIGVILLASPHWSPAHSQTAASFTVWLPVVIKANTNPIHQGIATYYNATGAGACSFDPSPADLMVAAMNAEEYDNSAVCGAYVHVIGP